MGDKGKGHAMKIVKRKREIAKKEDDLSHKLQGKLHHCLKDVKKAAKKAKVFETQKLVKKLKSLRAKNGGTEDITNLESELEILKRTDHEPFGCTALKTKIKKDKMLSTNEHMTAAVTAELSTDLVEPAKPGSHLAKVQGRLLSSKVLASEVSTVVEMLRLTIQPEKKVVQDSDSDGESDEEAELKPPSKKQKVAVEASSADSDNEESEDESRRVILSEDDADVDDGGWESGSVDGADDLEDEADDSEADDNREDDDDQTEDGDEDEEDDKPRPHAESVKTKKPTKESAAVKGKNASESTFLPSLSVGFTRGDSDASDWSDSEAKVADGVRKNRRGQRARRMIWEKKYGRNANHVKKQQADAAKDPRARGRPESGPPNARNDRSSMRSRPPIAHGGGGGPRSTAQASRPSAHDRKTEDKPLHPSWEAKRKLKEKQNLGIVPPQGKKIVF
ncbi:hypothetical protein EIP86_008601 [Pleurotus ostreatoroseus]|nr:hypothetical protein EIP86_008601 [Pleurotus ostreatoroseus]